LKPWLYRLGWTLFTICLRTFFRFRIEGQENIPSEGGVILCANHFHAFDPPVLGCSIPPRRPVRFMAKAELFTIPVFGALLRWVGTFPVRRGQADRTALRTALSLLASGEVFGIFPEGTRSRTGKLGKAEPGVAFIAAKAGCPIIPVAITSSYRLLSPIRVRIGRPIRMVVNREARLTQEKLDEIAAQIMSAIAALLEEEEASRDSTRAEGSG
jgi:1-acyl-sn-glycerol-3-phosphate acyltransferase